MKNDLHLWFGDALVGVLSVAPTGWSLRYDGSWTQFALSPALPLGVVHTDGAGPRTVQWFFDNLLPEERVRAALALAADVDVADTHAFLRRYGRETAGALTLLPEGDLPAPATGYLPLSRAELRAHIANSPRVPLIAAGGKGRMSLAGAQHKQVLHRMGEQLLLPDGGASTLIAKPDNASPEYPFCPANEHFCMRLALAAGLSVPRVELWRLPEPLYVVERFDRIPGDPVKRLHQIDLCQLLNRPPAYKYDVTFEETFAAAFKCVQPAVAQRDLLRRLAFNFIIGNSDAHAKNFGFLVNASGLLLAPAYDLLSVKVYGDDYMAMTIGDEARYGHVEASDWTEMAKAMGVKPSIVHSTNKQLAIKLPSLARTLIDDPVYTEDERAFLHEIVGVIDLHASYLVG